MTLATALLAAPDAGAQSQPAAASPTTPPSAEQQIAAAVLAAPADMRAGATVLGYGPDGHITTLRQGGGALTCLASEPKAERFHVACYHRSLEPFMARGRALRAHGVTGDQVDSVRFAEVRSGKLRMPRHPAVLYSLTGPADSFDPATGTAPKARPLFVVYVPFATGRSMGLSTTPAEGAPWIMHPGTPKAHIMFEPGM
ncbi:MAG TPA: hypothetical protein VGR09_10115 [Gemmatimonadales bacterium]|nr:hypothetical protein [Gemmatimonadales bacterium]